MSENPPGAPGPLEWLDEIANARRAVGLRRQLRPRSATAKHIDLASNDYLGLAQDSRVIDGAISAVRDWGTGSTGSRLVTGTTTLHEQLEDELAEFAGHQAGLVFSSGYQANLGTVVALSGRGSLIVSDGGSHASLIDACCLSRARVVVTERGDSDAVAVALAKREEERAIVVTDSVYSADGALAPIAQLYQICRQYGAVLIADEAHGLGVRGEGGRGLVAELGLSGREDLVVTGTLSKALASQGGVVLSSTRVREHLIDTARTFIFDTGLNPAAVGAARAALKVLCEYPQLATRVLDNATELAATTGADAPTSAVVSVILGDPVCAVAARDAAWERGVSVGCFRPPSVPEGTSRLRLTARADLSRTQLDEVTTVLRQVLDRYGPVIKATV